MRLKDVYWHVWDIFISNVLRAIFLKKLVAIIHPMIKYSSCSYCTDNYLLLDHYFRNRRKKQRIAENLHFTTKMIKEWMPRLYPFVFDSELLVFNCGEVCRPIYVRTLGVAVQNLVLSNYYVSHREAHVFSTPRVKEMCADYWVTECRDTLILS